MSELKNIHKFEKAICAILNLDGWNVQWSGAKYEHYDAKGFTPKGFPCVIEMKFRKDYYKNKLSEKSHISYYSLYRTYNKVKKILKEIL